MSPHRALLLALILASPAAARPKAADLSPTVPTTLDRPLPNDPMHVVIRRLANGLTVYLSPNKGVPRVTAWITVRAGSKNDPPESTGIAHYLEHMLFKGTTKLGTLDAAREAPHLQKIQDLYEQRAKTKDPKKRAEFDKLIDAENVADAASAAPNEIDKFYRAIGAQGVNAFTSNERTVFVADIPANRLEAWAAVESERFRDPVFRLFPTELEAVYEEKNRSMDNADAAFWEELDRELYKVHPYGQQTTLGTVEHLKNPSLARMHEFYSRWYVPNNMAIALAGDFDPDQAMEIITRRFSSWTPKPLPVLPKWALPKPHGEETSELKFEAEDKVALAWPVVASSAPDADAITVMDMLMDNSASGLLNLRLNQAQKVKASGSGPSLLNDAGAWYLWADPKQGQTPEEAKALLLQTVAALKRGEFDQADLDAIMTNFEIGRKRELESNESRASTMIDSFISYEQWERTVGRLDRLRKVTKEDVMRVAAEYLGDDRVVVIRRGGKPVIPQIEKPNYTALQIDPARESAFLKEVLAIPAKPLEPRWLVSGRDYQMVPVAGGRLYAAKNPYDDLFDLTVRFARGSRQARGLCEALDLLDLSGAGPLSADEFKKKLYALGTTLSYSCDEQESSVSLSGVDRNFWPSIELAAQRFDWPNVSSGTLEDMISVDLGGREDEKKDAGSVYHALAEYAQRGRDSSVLARLSNDELKRLSETAVKDMIRDFPHWQHRVGYVGPRSASEVAKLLDASERFKSAPPRRPVRYVHPSSTRLLFTNRPMVQARVGLQAPDEIYDPEHAVDYEFFADYMGGDMSSVIFQEVREARSLAYSAGGGHSVSAFKNDETQLWGSLGCQADKTPEATELMLKLLRGLPASPERFAATAKSIDQSYRTNPVEFRDIPAAVMGWEDEGLTGGDPGPARFARAEAYTLPDLESFASRFKDKPMTVWILGERDRVGLDKLKTLGAFEEKTVGDLFPY
jgi:predicted Zn-dependent peptidase